jgi:two-component system, NarL family, sensor kinase
MSDSWKVVWRRFWLVGALLVAVAMATSSQAQMLMGLDRDSLRAVLRHQPDDTVKVQTLITTGQQFENSNQDTAIVYYKAAKALSDKLGYPAGVLMYFANITAVLNVQGKYAESRKLNEEAVRIASRHGLRMQLGKAYANLGAVCQYQEDYRAAIDYYLKALPIVKSFGQDQAVAMLYSNLCGLYRNLRQPEKALAYAQQALALGESLHDPYATGNACINLGNALKDLNRIDEAIAHYQRTLKIGQEVFDLTMRETALINLGEAYMKQDLVVQYMDAFMQALPLTDSLQDVSGKAFVYKGIATGLFQQHKFDGAEAYIEQGLVYAREHDQKEIMSALYLLLSDVQLVLGRYDAADRFRERHDSLNHVLLNETLFKDVQELETAYKVGEQRNELLQKDLLLQQQAAETAQHRFWLIAAIVVCVLMLVLLVLAVLFYRQRRELHRAAVQTLKTEQEAIRLKATLDGQVQERQRISEELHDDLGGGLTSMLFISRALRQAPEEHATLSAKMETIASKLIDKMNEIIWAMSHENDSLADLVAYIRVQADDMLKNADLQFTCQIHAPIPDIQLSQHDRHQIYLVVKEALHNIVKHARASAVTIDFHSFTPLRVSIRDNGRGLSAAPDALMGNGLRNMQKRARELRGALHVFGDNGTVVQLETVLPV